MFKSWVLTYGSAGGFGGVGSSKSAIGSWGFGTGAVGGGSSGLANKVEAFTVGV